ncbi:putative short chain dehydrogenase [Fusarium austroafricanum]|uniref:Putative short chain dehydrogenase n=1 Tax=Fusarium austroafricanum TaxID=2364996 RepID=A0A8H4KWP4_9HYPO|nr:putative short chain dehydrogenase [Fusarium austroafricanum]
MVRTLITGSADGLGLEAARQLIERKHTVYLHARTPQEAGEAKAKCLSAAGVFIGDLANIWDTQSLARDINARGAFDVIIHNAELLQGPFVDTPEKTIPARIPSIAAANVLAPYILTCCVTPPKRLIFLGSELHREADLSSVGDTFWKQRGEGSFETFQAYCDSKLHVMLLANAVAKRLKSTSVLSVDPGWVDPEMSRGDAPGKFQDAVDTYVMLAEGDYDQTLTGKYLEAGMKPSKSLPECEEDHLQEWVLEDCERLVQSRDRGYLQ